MFHGPPPDLHVFGSPEEESAAVGAWLDDCLRDGIVGETIAVLVRSENELRRAETAIAASSGKHIKPGLMHDSKGRECRAVAVMACDADILPSESRLMEASDQRALKEIYDTERHLLYVAATRARERLWLFGERIHVGVPGRLAHLIAFPDGCGTPRRTVMNKR